MLDDPQTQAHVSVASIWEIAIQSGVDRGDFRLGPPPSRLGLLDNGYAELPVISEHAVAFDGLPNIHKDPFDRRLVDQAVVEGVTLLASSAPACQYGGQFRRV